MMKDMSSYRVLRERDWFVLILRPSATDDDTPDPDFDFFISCQDTYVHCVVYELRYWTQRSITVGM